MTALAPPELHGFDWSGTNLAQLLNAGSIRLTYERLSQVAAFLDGRAQCLEACSWVDPLVKMAKQDDWNSFNGELVARPLPMEINDFMKWLARQCMAKVRLDTATLLHELSIWKYLFRNRNISSFNNLKTPVLRYIRHQFIEQEIVKMIIFARTSTSSCPLVLAIGIAANFIAIHPFPDGNGRAGRELLVDILRNYELWGGQNLDLSFLLNRDKYRYLSLQQALFVSGEWDHYLKYMCSALRAAAEMSFLAHLSSQRS